LYFAHFYGHINFVAIWFTYHKSYVLSHVINVRKLLIYFHFCIEASDLILSPQSTTFNQELWWDWSTVILENTILKENRLWMNSKSLNVSNSSQNSIFKMKSFLGKQKLTAKYNPQRKTTKKKEIFLLL
jgi:hypothetical protein